jgi:hypothetical protein
MDIFPATPIGRRVTAALIRLLQTIHVDPTDISQHPELLKYYEDLRVCGRGTTWLTYRSHVHTCKPMKAQLNHSSFFPLILELGLGFWSDSHIQPIAGEGVSVGADGMCVGVATNSYP